MRIAVPDYISPSYFPAIAAVEAGFLKEEGVEGTIELMFPVTDAAAALRDGEIDLLAGAAHAPLHAFPEFRGARLLASLSQRMYWFLVVRADAPVERGQLNDLRDMRIGAAPGPDLGLFQLLADKGVDLEEANLKIGPVPSTGDTASVSFGVSAAEALAAGTIDGFWANGMGAEVAVRQGTGKVVLDARRDEGAGSDLTFAALMATESFVQEQPDAARSAVRAIRRAQQALTDDPGLAGELGSRLYPAYEASLIAGLIERDAPYYQAKIPPSAIEGLARLGRGAGLLTTELAYEQVVATELAPVWSMGTEPAGETRR